MRGASLSLLFLLGCTVAVDDFELCEAPAFVVERASCMGSERTCTVGCFDTIVDDDIELVTCLEACGEANSPCLTCIFGIAGECAIGECLEFYQDLSCCSLERCGAPSFECGACPDEITAFRECALSATSVGAVCSNELLVPGCYEN